MLGHYENFPATVHKIAYLISSASRRRIQQTLVQMLLEENTKSLITQNGEFPSIPECKIILEFGIAEGDTFNYLSEEETNRIVKILSKEPFSIMDFFCSARYYKLQEEKEMPLRFDYYFLRFKFDEKNVEAHIRHERGPRHVSPDELAEYLIDKVGRKLQAKGANSIHRSFEQNGKFYLKDEVM